MFIGEYRHSLDSKGRLAIPAKFRLALSEGAVVTRGLDNCLWIFPKKEWRILAKKLASLPLSQANSRAFVRLMLAGAMDTRLDSQGRMVVPDYLRRYATLGRKVVIIGLYNRLEIWTEKIWQAYQAKTEKSGGQIAEKLSELGI